MAKRAPVVLFMLITIVFYWACAQQSGPTAEEQQNLATMNRIYDEFINKGDESVFDEIVAADVVEHEELPGFQANREGVKQFFSAFRGAFPDLHFQVDDIFASGDKVAARLTIHGTQQGQFMNIPATGKEISVKAMDIVRFANGKLVEHWGVTDNMAMMQQLGVVPEEPR